MAGLGAPEMLIVLSVVLLLFGGSQVPKLARSLGQAQRELAKVGGAQAPTTRHSGGMEPATAGSIYKPTIGM